MHKLTGEWKSSINMASSKFYYDRDNGGFPESLLEAIDFGDFLDKYPQDVLDVGTVVGGLRKEAAEELGLKEGTPVAEGAIDAYAGAIGLGVVEPGKIALITGSSHVMIGQTPSPIYDPGFWGAYTDALIPGQYTVEAGQASTGSVVAWFKNQFAADAVAEAEKRGVDSYEVLTEMAEEVPIGSDGLIFLDYLQGNRSPYTDPAGARHDLGIVSRAYSGPHLPGDHRGVSASAPRISSATMRGHDFEPRLNVVSGGPAKSELWMQMHADVSNVPIAFTRVSEGPVLGSAVIAAVGAGMYPDIPTASENMVQTERTIEPNEEAHEAYQFYMNRYIETYPQMKDLMHKTTQHVTGAQAAGE